MNLNALKKAFEAYGAAKRQHIEAVAALKAALNGTSRDEGRAALLPLFAARYSVPLVISESPRNAGATVLDSTHANYEACKFALRDCLNDVYPRETSEKNAPQRRLRISEAEQKLSDKIIAQVIDLGLTREHFDALIARVKAGVSW